MFTNDPTLYQPAVQTTLIFTGITNFDNLQLTQLKPLLFICSRVEAKPRPRTLHNTLLSGPTRSIPASGKQPIASEAMSGRRAGRNNLTPQVG